LNDTIFYVDSPERLYLSVVKKIIAWNVENGLKEIVFVHNGEVR
jgi:hypothetical protein